MGKEDCVVVGGARCGRGSCCLCCCCCIVDRVEEFGGKLNNDKDEDVVAEGGLLGEDPMTEPASDPINLFTTRFGSRVG